MIKTGALLSGIKTAIINYCQMKKFFPVLLLLSTLIAYTATGQKNPALAPGPPMGWNSWNWFGKQDINEKIVYEVIDAMVEFGLRDAGYNYVIVDGGWRDIKLGPNGELLPHPVKFPNGIKPLVDYAHSRGLKFGLHTVPGTHDCGDDPVGGFNREEIHIQQFVSWGVDFLKVDLCHQVSDPCETCVKSRTGWSEETISTTYGKWSNLLYNCGRDIVFSISAYEFRDFYPEVCNMARTTYDIRSRRQKDGTVFNSESRENRGLLSVMTCAEINNRYARYAGNGYWNDPDMLVTGNQGLNETEQESHFALWSIKTAPLFLGNDPRNMSNSERKLILNREIIAINQDTSQQGYLFADRDGIQIWRKSLSDGRSAILILNLNPGDSGIQVDLMEIGLEGKLRARDVINRKNISARKGRVRKVLPPHGCLYLLVSEK
jgi:alpha-galactosidase